jgi:hypothetical protein
MHRSPRVKDVSSRRKQELTSVVLLLLMVIAQLTLSLRGHSSLRLHSLLSIVAAARSLMMPLLRVEVLQIRALMRSARFAVIGHRALARTAVTHATSVMSRVASRGYN